MSAHAAGRVSVFKITGRWWWWCDQCWGGEFLDASFNRYDWSGALREGHDHARRHHEVEPC